MNSTADTTASGPALAAGNECGNSLRNALDDELRDEPGEELGNECGNSGDAKRVTSSRASAAQPDLELVAVPRNESFKVWSHGYPYRTVRWHFHPEYEIHLITATSGKYFVGDFIGNFTPGNLVMTGAHLPHNWVSNVPSGTVVSERCVVLQFDAAFIAQALSIFPEMKRITSLLDASHRGILFTEETGAAAQPIMREMLGAHGMRRLTLFIALLDLLVHSPAQTTLASTTYRADPSHYAQTRINHVLSYIAKNVSQPLRETEFAELAGQSPSAFSRYFRRHTGVSFVQYVNRLRIDLACQLIVSGELSITDICYHVGFNNLSNFNRQFLRLQGMSPSRWRIHRLLNSPDGLGRAQENGAKHIMDARH